MFKAYQNDITWLNCAKESWPNAHYFTCVHFEENIRNSLLAYDTSKITIPS
jgi:hypothetical protein